MKWLKEQFGFISVIVTTIGIFIPIMIYVIDIKDGQSDIRGDSRVMKVEFDGMQDNNKEDHAFIKGRQSNVIERLGCIEAQMAVLNYIKGNITKQQLKKSLSSFIGVDSTEKDSVPVKWGKTLFYK
jgi:hypothetical protein